MNLEGKNRTTCDGMIRLTNATGCVETPSLKFYVTLRKVSGNLHQTYDKINSTERFFVNIIQLR